jgi:tagatose 6-phosphate kinase
LFLCVNANAAIDKTVLVPAFQLDQIHRPEQVVLLPGGKGINVARGLQTLGETVQVTGWAGGYAGQFIAAGLQKEGIQAEFAWCDFESRTCLSILDPANKTLTELYENGEPVPAAQAAELLALFQRLLPGASFVTISGKLSPGVPDDFYAVLLRAAAAAGVPAALDCSGESLRLGLEQGRPTLIKPNLAEFQALTGQQLSGLPALAAAARAAAVRWDTLVVLSLGADGAIAARAGEAWQARPPQVPVVSAVGSGDALLAGVVQGLSRGAALPDALRQGVAAGTANALTVGAGKFTLEDYERVLAGVEVSYIEG